MANGYYVRRSLFGPLLLIAIGVLMLLATLHLVAWPSLGVLFARYWPLLLIFLGVVRLLEFFWAKQSGAPTARLGGGAVVLIIFLVLIGIAATHAHRDIDWSQIQFGDNGEWSHVLMGEPHDYDLRQDVDLAAGKPVQFRADRGDVTVTPSGDAKVHVLTHLTVYAHSGSDADALKAKFNATARQDQEALVITSSGPSEVKPSFEVQVPPAAAVDVSTGRGDVSIRDRKASASVEVEHGEVNLQQIAGNATIRSGNSADVTAHGIDGDLVAQGKFNDMEATGVTGQVSLDGDFRGDLRLQNIGKGLRFHSSRTDFELAKIEGSLDMSIGDLRAASITGPVRLVTRDKDVHLEQISGDVDIENRNASVEIFPSLPIGNVRVQNTTGSIDFTVPPNANFTLQASAQKGEIDSDLDLKVENTDNGDSTASGAVGKGGNSVRLSANKGSINIRKQ